MRKEEGKGAQAHGDISWEATGSSERNSGSRRRGKEGSQTFSSQRILT